MASEYYEVSPDAALKQLNTTQKGLSNLEARKRLEQYGRNILEQREKINLAKIFANQFKNFLVWILIVAVVISLLIQSYIDAAVIGAILISNAFIGTFQEYKASKAIEALKDLSAPKAKVLRDGKLIEISSIDVVPGDILYLQPGAKVAADARLIDAVNLRVDESLLTGESTPVEKSINLINKKVQLAERKNSVFSNTNIVNGTGWAVVYATGQSTQVGKIAELISSVKDKETPLQKKLGEIGKKIGLITLVVIGAVFGLGVFRGIHPLEMLITSISLAVAAVPEGLPAVITIALAMGIQRMAKAKAIMRSLPAVETLGSTNVICTDKTGTLTKNQMTVKNIYVNKKIIDVTGNGYVPKGLFKLEEKTIDPDPDLDLLLTSATLCNNALLQSSKKGWNIVGDPTEGALVVAAAKAGLTQQTLLKTHQKLSELSFDSNRKMMSVIYKTDKDIVAYVKGAPDVLLEKSSYIYRNGGIHKLTAKHKKEILETNEKFGSNALRVLGIAYRVMPRTSNFTTKNVERDLIFVGLVGMKDPPRLEVKSALKEAEEAGIKVIMVTGDHKTTATAIAKELGILTDTSNVIDGKELEKMADGELESALEHTHVFARVTPEHKIRLVRVLQKKRYVVAMTGDGVNDAPALKAADIGIAMGRSGTEVAKQASDMILADDDFATIVGAVREGRTIFDNIRKFLRFLLSSNVGEVLTIFVASLIALPLPLIAVQILWMNLLTDGLPAIALASDPPEKGLMKRKPRNLKEPVLNKDMMITIALVGAVMTIGTLYLFNQTLNQGLMMAQTVAFTSLIIFQMFNVFNSRSQTNSFLTDFLNNKWLLIAVGSSIALQFLVIYSPLNILFGTQPLSFAQWTQIILVAGSIFVVMEVKKFFSRSYA